MATVKISELGAINSNDLTATDLFHVVDTGAISQTYPTGTNKRVTASTLASRLAALNTTTIPPVVQAALDLKLSTADFNSAGLKITTPVVAATVAPITLASTFAGASIDGVTLVAGNRLLVKDQGTTSQNGIYVIATSPTVPTRALDFDAPSEINGGYVLVNGGTSQKGSGWAVTSTVTTVGTSPIIFTQFASAVTGLSKTAVGLGDVDNTSDANKPLSNAVITELALKQNTITGAVSDITTSNLAFDRALISSASGKIIASTVTSAQIGHLSGVTGPIQTQLDGKALKENPTFTGNVTLPSTTTVNGVTVSPIPPGAVMAFAMATPPSGWLACNGASVDRSGPSGYPALWTAIGTTYGSTSGSTFNLPDLRGYFVRGWDNSRGIDPGRALGTNQDDELKSHSHTYLAASAPASIPALGGGANQYLYTNVTSGTSSTGGTETRPKNIAMLYCIKI